MSTVKSSNELKAVRTSDEEEEEEEKKTHENYARDCVMVLRNPRDLAAIFFFSRPNRQAFAIVDHLFGILNARIELLTEVANEFRDRIQEIFKFCFGKKNSYQTREFACAL